MPRVHAGATVAMPAPVNVGVRLVVGVSSRAMRLVSPEVVRATATNVLGVRDWLKVIWANAKRDEAQMVDRQALRDGADSIFVCPAVGESAFAHWAETWPAAFDEQTARPQPAGAEVRSSRWYRPVLVDLAPEALVKRGPASVQVAVPRESAYVHRTVTVAVPRVARFVAALSSAFQGVILGLHRVTSGVMWADVLASRPHLFYAKGAL